MSYALGQAKILPGQIHFQTTRTGRIPSLQPLIEAGLPIAPYIEHGSWETGQPAIMRYGLDPYRGLGQPASEVDRRMDEAQERVEETVIETIRATLSPAVMVGTGVMVGAAAGVAGGLLRSALWGGLLGAVGGGVLGYMGWKSWGAPPPQNGTSTPAQSGLSGMLAVL